MASQESTESQDQDRLPKKYSLKEGYDILFIQQPPEEIQLECSVCLQVLSDPCILDCKCGYSFCRECIEPIKNKGSRCPLCTMKFSIILPNIRLDKAKEQLRTNCPNDTLGCTWTGELGRLRQHLNTPVQAKNRHEGCEYATIQCLLCSFECKRRELANHESQQCPERQYTCEFCQEYTSTFREVYTTHWPKCTQFNKFCENGASTSPSTSQYKGLTMEGSELHTILHISGSQPLKYLGSSERALHEHKHKAQCHANDRPCTMLPKLLPTTSKNARKAISGERKQLTMNNFSKLNPDNIWYSWPFYSHDELGYNLCLSVQRNSLYLSVSTHILRGEHDTKLQWPFEGEVSIKLVGRDPERSHCRVIEYTNLVAIECTGRIKGQQERSKGLGKQNFIACRNLVPNFLQNDSLWFDIQCAFYM